MTIDRYSEARKRQISAGRVLILLVASAAMAFSARIAAAMDPVDYVKPIEWSRFHGLLGVQPGDAFGASLAKVVQNESGYELKWVSTQYKQGRNSGGAYYDPFTHYRDSPKPPRLESMIRPLASFATGTAIVLAFHLYSEEAAGGVTEAQAFEQLELAIRGVAYAHKANLPKKTVPAFGGAGDKPRYNQAAYWTEQAALAAWLVWDRLSADTRAAVANMVLSEANSFLKYPVPYWKTPDGVETFPGDTKAEENAWNALFLVLAQAMMPTHPNVNTWRTIASELQIAAHSSPSDLVNATLVEGRPVKDWVHGYNTFDDGVLVNHKIVHPDYFVSALHLQSSAIVIESLAGQYIPQSNVVNTDRAYRALTTLKFKVEPNPYGTGPTIAPGGPIFTRTGDGKYSAKIYYPQGTDWTYEVTGGFINTDLFAKWLGYDQKEGFDAMGWAQARLDAFIALQSRDGQNGQIYKPSDWLLGDVASADEDVYRANAMAWIQWRLMKTGKMSPIADHWGELPEPPSKP